MSLVEPNFRTELAAHYSAVHARLWAGPRRQRAEPATPPEALAAPRPQPLPELSPSEPPPIEPLVVRTAAKWREIDMRVFGGRVSPKAVINVTAAYFCVDVRGVIAGPRVRPFMTARYASMYLIRLLCANPLGPLSSVQIGQHFNKDHATVLYAIPKIVDRMDKDPTFASSIADIIRLLNRDAE